MNNNRGNNRRRGRGNRQQGGGQQLNRIDSRARGNAPQLLEKYRKLAHDAHLNGDRVQAEYYLQFADHYFRVIADGRQRQEESRLRRDDRGEGASEDQDDNGDYGDAGDFPSFDQPSYNNRPPRDERPSQRRPAAEDRAEQGNDGNRADEEEVPQGEVAEANPYEPAENPFVRDSRPRGGLRPRREDRRPRGEERSDEGEAGGLDPSSLPPAISAAREPEPVVAEEAPAKPRRGRPRKPRNEDGAGEPLESVS